MTRSLHGTSHTIGFLDSHSVIPPRRTSIAQTLVPYPMYLLSHNHCQHCRKHSHRLSADVMWCICGMWDSCTTTKQSAVVHAAVLTGLHRQRPRCRDRVSVLLSQASLTCSLPFLLPPNPCYAFSKATTGSPEHPPVLQIMLTNEQSGYEVLEQCTLEIRTISEPYDPLADDHVPAIVPRAVEQDRIGH